MSSYYSLCQNDDPFTVLYGFSSAVGSLLTYCTADSFPTVLPYGISKEGDPGPGLLIFVT
jgi:hypothetical protein